MCSRRTRSTSASSTLANLVLIGIACTAVGVFGSLGAATSAAIAGTANKSWESDEPRAPALVSQQSGAITSAFRFGPKAVQRIRTIASEIPAGATRAVSIDDQNLTIGHIPSLTELLDFVGTNTPKYAKSSEAEAIAQRDNLAHLINRAFDETIARGNIPGPGGWFSAKKADDPFHAADVPWGVFAYNAHASSTSFSISKDGALLDYARDMAFEKVVRADLEQIGYRHEPLILDACQAGKCFSSATSPVRRIAEELQAPIIAPTKNVFITTPMPNEGRHFQGRLVGNSVTTEDGLRLPVASGDWVLVLPESWGGDVIRGPNPLSD